MSKLIRISDKVYEKLISLEETLESSKQEVLEKALEQLAREKLLEKANKAYKRLKDDPKLWEEELEERMVFEGTLDDKLD